MLYMHYKTIVFIYFFYVCGSLPFVCCFCKCCCHHVSPSLTYVHASPAHLYIPPLFTHCLPTLCVFFYNIIVFYITQIKVGKQLGEGLRHVELSQTYT